MRGTQALTLAALAAVLAFVTAGCGDNTAGTMLDFHTLAAPDSAEFKLLEAVVAEFNRVHPGSSVRLVSGRLRIESLMRAIIAQESREILEVRPEEVAVLARRGALMMLTGACFGLQSELHPSGWALGQSGSDVFAVPFAAQPKLLLCNRNALRAAGIPDDAWPRSWDELISVARKVKEQAQLPGHSCAYGFALAGKRCSDLGRHFATFMAQLGTPLLSESDVRPVFNIDTEHGRRALSLLAALRDVSPPECVVDDDAKALKQFRNGHAAMVLAGPAGLRQDPAQPMDVGVCPVPIPPFGNIVCDAGFRMVCLPTYLRDRPEKDEAIRFVQFLAGRAAQEILARGVDGVVPFIPVRHDVLAGESYRPNRPLGVFAAALSHPAPIFPVFVWEGRCSEVWVDGLHELLLRDPITRGGIAEATLLAGTRGNQALGCLYTDIGHPTTTVTLGMTLVAVLVFVAVAYAVSRH